MNEPDSTSLVAMETESTTSQAGVQTAAPMLWEDHLFGEPPGASAMRD